MLINYWDCKYKDYEEFWDGETEDRSYGCTNPKKEDHCCDINNKYGGEKAECPIAENAGSDYRSEQIITKDIESGAYSFENGILKKID